jgi:hypothetical protein
MMIAISIYLYIYLYIYILPSVVQTVVFSHVRQAFVDTIAFLRRRKREIIRSCLVMLSIQNNEIYIYIISAGESYIYTHIFDSVMCRHTAQQRLDVNDTIFTGRNQQRRCRCKFQSHIYDIQITGVTSSLG